MPFSTYLRDPDPQSVHSQQHHQHGLEESSHSNGSTPPISHLNSSSTGHRDFSLDAITQHHNGFYQQQDLYYHQNSDSTGLSVKTMSSYPPSHTTSLYGYQHYLPPSSSDSPLSATLKPQNTVKDDGIFQMPPFLFGDFNSIVAPGGGAEVITPVNALSLNVSHPSTDVDSTQTLDAKSWQTTTNCDDPVVVPSVSTTPSIPNFENYLPSPFAYIHIDSPSDKVDSAHHTETIVDEHPNSTNISSTSCSVPSSNYHDMINSVSEVENLPVYSQSGFNMLEIFRRVDSRANPTISLGPVDLSCSFVVADARHPDTPIIYASRTFCELTGYLENEIIGKNCRFLQAPGGCVSRSEIRQFTNQEAVREIYHSLALNREVQVSLINYRKDGTPFLNRVSIVPIPTDDNSSEIAYYVGFQINLNTQPEIIARRMKEGSFYSPGLSSFQKPLTPVEQSVKAMGRSLRAFLLDPKFQTSVSLSTSCNITVPLSNQPSASSLSTPTTAKNGGTNNTPDARDERQWLQLSLLETSPDFILVLSLKGSFSYVSPSVRHVIGHEPADLVGKSIADYCHPDDSIPLLRALKESGITIQSQGTKGNNNGRKANLHVHSGRRVVDLLFRMKTSDNHFTWVECLGRMHIEPAKGRKAVILSGRTCTMPSLRWDTAGLMPLTESADSCTFNNKRKHASSQQQQPQEVDREFWAMLCNDGLFLVTGVAVRDILGWGTGEMIGRSIRDFLLDVDEKERSDMTIFAEKVGAETCVTSSEILSLLERISVAVTISANEQNATKTLICRMKRRDGKAVWMQVVLFAPTGTNSKSTSWASAQPSSQRIIAQFRTLSSFPSLSRQTTASTATKSSSISLTQQTSTIKNILAELEPEHQSSWQYELQQLKFANDKLREEIDGLEKRPRQQERTPWLEVQA